MLSSNSDSSPIISQKGVTHGANWCHCDLKLLHPEERIFCWIILNIMAWIHGNHLVKNSWQFVSDLNLFLSPPKKCGVSNFRKCGIHYFQCWTYWIFTAADPWGNSRRLEKFISAVSSRRLRAADWSQRSLWVAKMKQTAARTWQKVTVISGEHEITIYIYCIYIYIQNIYAHVVSIDFG